jgi:hypothetical protein
VRLTIKYRPEKRYAAFVLNGIQERKPQSQKKSQAEADLSERARRAAVDPHTGLYCSTRLLEMRK